MNGRLSLLKTLLLALVAWFVLLVALGLGGALEKWQIVVVTVAVFGTAVVVHLLRSPTAGPRPAARAEDDDHPAR